jgi:Fe2+ or Zn2+ uptake regulation protein
MVGVAQELVSYLLTHPGACDTLDGIARWWFETEHSVSVQQLRQALDELVRQGLLEASASADGRVRYRRLADLSALQSFLGP